MKEKVERIDYGTVELKSLAASVLKWQWYLSYRQFPLEDSCTVEEEKHKSTRKLHSKGVLLSGLSYVKQREPKLHVLKTNYSTFWQIEYKLSSEIQRLIS